MNQSILYENNENIRANAHAIEVSRVLPYGLLLAGALVAGAGCTARPNVVSPPKVVHPSMPRIERLEGTVERNYAELLEEVRKYGAREGILRELELKYGALKHGQDDLTTRLEKVQTMVGEMLQIQAMILQRPLNQASVLINKEKHGKVYWALFETMPWSSDVYRQSAATNGTYIYLAHTIGGGYRAQVVSDVTKIGDSIFIGRYQPLAQGISGRLIPAARIKEMIPEGVMQQFLYIKEVKQINIPGRDDLNVPTPKRTPSKRPFTRAQHEKWTMLNGQRPIRKTYQYVRR